MTRQPPTAADLLAATQDRLAALPGLTGGFLTDPTIAPLHGGVLLRARFDTARFDPALFARLAVDRPARLDRAVDKRLAEYLAGRCLARLSQQALGFAPRPVPAAASRAPIWPPGLSGSISHAAGQAACLLLPRDDATPGLDLESIAAGRALEAIDKTALSDADRAHLAALPDPAIAATLCFSAKESLFKALFPTVGRFFGFDAAELAAPPGDGTLTLRLTRPLHGTLPPGRSFDLQYRVAPPHVLTWMVFTPAA
ncbi:4'-phosphopantetheinyl transferase superfamily protein [Thalassococcus sp. CAU 1522]|uniref:Enterobactin synthase component D n=1 Tax=Thalassococcus arenae TaxID=2851652 RepID=A0ABS6N6Y4_9RHOB|nr:4'-phosphopantetheinyl transferase superfamily protein [Thalassococcus arenae]MBV2359785.1 4'-phosphopantetheinyl transferase superfamily protein [Thalassococcus arenae]